MTTLRFDHVLQGKHNTTQTEMFLKEQEMLHFPIRVTDIEILPVGIMVKFFSIPVAINAIKSQLNDANDDIAK